MYQDPVVQKIDNAIYYINLYLLDNVIGFGPIIFLHWIGNYPMDSAIQRPCLNSRGLVKKWQ